MKKYIYLSSILLIAGCKTPEMAVSPELKTNSEILSVKGRQGFQIGRKITFGNFTTDNVKQGWVKGYDIPFIVRFQGMKEKLSFQQFGKVGQVADVYCIGKFRSVELDGLRDFFDIVLKEKNHFAGTVITKGGTEVWDFLLFNPDGELFDKSKAGFIRKNNELIEVKGVKKLDNIKTNLAQNFWGYEFIHQGKSLGAVETVNNGRVWISNDLDEDIKLVLASVSSSLLLKTNLEDRIE